MSTLFKDVIYVDGSMECGKRADVLVENGVISKIEAPGTLKSNNIVDGGGRKALIPGFVNCHTHAAMALLRGIGEESPLKEWLEQKIWPVEANLNPERIYWGTRSAALEMAATGTTCFADMYFEMDQVGQASLDSGLRSGLARGIIGDDQKRIEENLSLIDRFAGNPMISVQMGPHAPYTVPFDSLKEIASIAKVKNIPVHFHYLETEWEVGYIRESTGLNPLDYLEKAGLLDLKELILAHSVWMPESAMKTLSKRNVTVVHNPGSNLKLGSGIAPISEMLKSGMSVAIGTDGAASNNRLDMWDEIRSTALLHKGVQMDPTVIKAQQVLDCATYRGAHALGFENVGRVSEGWAADLVLVDLDKPNYIGVDEANLAVFLVYAGSSSDVEGTMINGKWAYYKGEYPGVNVEEVMAEARRARNELVEKR